MAYTYAGRYGADGIIDSAGNAQPAASVRIRLAGTGTNATLYTDRTKGATTSNPITPDAVGNISFYVDPGEYDLVITIGAAVSTKRVLVPVDPAETVLVDQDNVYTADQYIRGGHPWYDVSGLSTAQTQAAIDAAPTRSVIYFGPGLHFRGTLLLKSGIRVCGAGMDATTIVLNDNTNDNVFGYPAGGLNEVEISDLAIDGNRAGQSSGSSHAISFPNFAKSSIRRVRTFNTVSLGINLHTCNDTVVEQCEVSDTDPGAGAINAGAGAGINLTTCTRVRLIGNRVHDVPGIGIVFGGSDETFAIGNIVKGAGFIGIAISGSTGGTIVGNTVESAVDNGIDLGGATDSTITGNTVRSCGGGIVSDGAARLTITGNSVWTTTGTDEGLLGIGIGLITNGQRGGVIAGNVVHLAYGHGIVIDGLSDASITGNVVTDSCTGLAAGGANGIMINATNHNAQNILIMGNRCLDTRGTKKQGYGLGILSATGTAGLCRVIGNDFAGNLTGTISNSGTAASTFFGNNPDTTSTVPGEVVVRDGGSGFPGLAFTSAAGTVRAQYAADASNGTLYQDFGAGGGDAIWRSIGGAERLRLFNGGGLALGASGPQLLAAAGSPEGAVTAPVGSIFMRTNGGAATSVYVKESGAGNTGWVAK